MSSENIQHDKLGRGLPTVKYRKIRLGTEYSQSKGGETTTFRDTNGEGIINPCSLLSDSSTIQAVLHVRQYRLELRHQVRKEIKMAESTNIVHKWAAMAALSHYVKVISAAVSDIHIRGENHCPSHP